MSSSIAGPRHTLLPTLALIGVTAAWGSTFFMTKDVVDLIPVPDYLGVRFALAAVVLCAVLFRQVRALSPAARRQALWLGLVYGLAQLLQTEGLARVDASVSGFVTGMYVVLTPVLGLALFRHRPPASTWWAVALATVGLGFLSLRGYSLSLGVVLTLLSAGLYALHIVLLGRWSTSADALGMSAVQMVAIAVCCGLAAAPGGVQLPPTASSWWAVIHMSLVAGALALVLQTWAQAHLPAARAAIIMTTEPVFATLFAVWFGGESLTARIIVGGTLVLVAMAVVELVPLLSRRPGASQPQPSAALHHE